MLRLGAMQPDGWQLNFRAVELRGRLRHIEVGNDPAAPAIFGEFERPAVRFNGVGDERNSSSSVCNEK